VQSRQPNNFRLFNLIPLFILFVAADKVVKPSNQVLKRLGRSTTTQPIWWHLTIEDTIRQVIELLRHTDLTDKRLLKIREAALNQVE